MSQLLEPPPCGAQPAETVVPAEVLAPLRSAAAALIEALEELDRATGRVTEGAELLRRLSATALPGRTGAAARGGARLTPREQEVLAALSAAKGYGQIAAELHIELETVRTHARSVRRKLGVRTSRELVGRLEEGARAESTADTGCHS